MRHKWAEQICSEQTKKFSYLAMEASHFLLNFAKNPFLSEKRLSTSKQIRKFRMKSSSEGRWCIDLAQKMWYLAIRKAWWRRRAVVSSTKPKHNWGEKLFVKRPEKLPVTILWLHASILWFLGIAKRDVKGIAMYFHRRSTAHLMRV